MLARPTITWQCSAGAARHRWPTLADSASAVNLLKNACDAQQAAGREQMPIVVNTCSVMAPELALAVRDHGNGDAGSRSTGAVVRTVFTTKPDGLGLGLSICKTIAGSARRQLSADIPADGPGLCLWLRLPCLENPLHGTQPPCACD